MNLLILFKMTHHMRINKKRVQKTHYDDQSVDNLLSFCRDKIDLHSVDVWHHAQNGAALAKEWNKEENNSRQGVLSTDAYRQYRKTYDALHDRSGLETLEIELQKFSKELEESKYDVRNGLKELRLIDRNDVQQCMEHYYRTGHLLNKFTLIQRSQKGTLQWPYQKGQCPRELRRARRALVMLYRIGHAGSSAEEEFITLATSPSTQSFAWTLITSCWSSLTTRLSRAKDTFVQSIIDVFNYLVQTLSSSFNIDKEVIIMVATIFLAILVALLVGKGLMVAGYAFYSWVTGKTMEKTLDEDGILDTIPEDCEFEQLNMIIAQAGEEKKVSPVVPKVLAAGLSKSFGLPSVPEKFVERFSKFCSQYTSVERCISSLFANFTAFGSMAYEHIFGEPFFDSDKMEAQITGYCQKLDKIHMIYNTSNIMTQATATEVINIDTKFDEYISNGVGRLKDTTAFTKIVSKRIACADIISKAKSIVFSTQARQTPLCIALIGKPGVGKTFIKDLMSNIMSLMVRGHELEPQDVFSRSQDNEYWEGYNGQFCTQIDDAFQIDDPAQRAKLANELIKMVNEECFHLHFAAVEEKSRNFFTSKLVMLTMNYESNLYLPSNLGIKDKGAVYRRMHLKVLVERADRNQPFDNDLSTSVKKDYKFTLLDQSGKNINTITFDELVYLARRKYEDLERSFLTRTNKIEGAARGIFENYTVNDTAARANYAKMIQIQMLQQPKPETYVEAVTGHVSTTTTTTTNTTSTTTTTTTTTVTPTIDENSSRNVFNEEFDELNPLADSTNSGPPKRAAPSPGKPPSDDDIGTSFENVWWDVNSLRPSHQDQARAMLEEELKHFVTDQRVFTHKLRADVVAAELRKLLRESNPRNLYILLRFFANNRDRFIYIFPDMLTEFSRICLKKCGEGENALKILSYFNELLGDRALPSATIKVSNLVPLIDEINNLMRFPETRALEYPALHHFIYARLKNMGGNNELVDTILNDLYQKSTVYDHKPSRFGRAKAFVSRLLNRTDLTYYCKFTDHEIVLCILDGTDSVTFFNKGTKWMMRCDPSTDKQAHDTDVRNVAMHMTRIIHAKPESDDNRGCYVKSKMAFCQLIHAMDLRVDGANIWVDLVPCVDDFKLRDSNPNYLATTRHTISGEYSRRMIHPLRVSGSANTYPTAPQSSISKTTVVKALAAIAGSAAVAYAIYTLAVAKFFPEVKVQSWTERDEKKAANIRRARNKKVKIKKVQQPSNVVVHTQAAVDTTVAKFIHNVENIRVEYENGTVGHVFLFFMHSSLAITVSHIFKLGPVRSVVLLTSGHEGQSEIRLFPSQYEISFDTTKDLAYVKFKVALQGRKDITKKMFSKEQDIKQHNNITKVDFSPDTGIVLLKRSQIATKKSVTSISSSGVRFALDNVYEAVNMDNDVGDCGLPYFVNDKFVGIHVAGFAGSAYVSPVYSEDITTVGAHALTDLTDCFLPNSRLDIRPASESVYLGLGTKARLHRADNGQPFSFHQNSHSQLERNRVTLGSDNLFFESKKEPAKLAPFTKIVEGEQIRVEPLKNALKKYQERNWDFPEHDLTVPKYFRGIFHEKFQESNVRLLEDDEVVNGIDGSMYVRSLDFSASPSVAFVEEGYSMLDVFPKRVNSDKRDINPEVKKLLDRRWKNIIENDEWAPYLCILTEKDELKSKAKVETPRLFANGSKLNLYEDKKILATFFEQVLNHGGCGDVYIGINPHGIPWEALAAKMSRRTKTKIIADDIEKWDLMFRSLFITALEGYMTKYTHLSKETIRLITGVFRRTLHPHVIIGSYIFSTNMMPSGSFSTAILNSMYHSWMDRFLFDLRMKELGEDFDFDEFVSNATFGDDGFQGVSDELPTEIWNGRVLARLRKKILNINTTPAAKNSSEIPDFMPLFSEGDWDDTKAQFLQRQFRLEDGRAYPILNIESIHSMMSYVRVAKNHDRLELEVQRIETALRELCYYPEQTFEKYRKWAEAAIQKWRPGYRLPFTREKVRLSYLHSLD